ncbi:hypothetical protein TPAU25S_02710 [Tsukamurella paurometabola]|uniref:DUF559 domain-containing protein n=3 Tax=Tsukamurella paurometabola TaxID=2061 RepID=D5UXW4_TSUPD|nr:hypothetical protein Tpau_3623 [Tsukamurella paurometabola DSM 20162]SUP38815.1 Uncharacterised protein [Tsukamurella paurometabola]
MMRRTHDLLSEATEHALRGASVSVIRGVRREGTEGPSGGDILDALQVAYPEAVFAGWTAAALHAVPYSDGHPPEIWLREQRRRQGIVVRCGHLAPSDVDVRSHRYVTSAVRTAIDLARFVPGDEAIVAVDQCLRTDSAGQSVTTKRDMIRYLDDHPRFYAGRRVRAVLDEASIGAESPWETYSRLVVHRAGFDMFVPQQPIPGTSYRVDLGSSKYAIAIEYDGAYHRSVPQQRVDIARWNTITGLGWSIIRVTSDTLLRNRPAFLARTEKELRSRGWRGPSPSIPPLRLPAAG